MGDFFWFGTTGFAYPVEFNYIQAPLPDLESTHHIIIALESLSQLPVVIEPPPGTAVAQLLQRNYTVYPANSTTAAVYRQRKMPSGTKADHIDAYSLADALGIDGQDWKPLHGVGGIPKTAA